MRRDLSDMFTQPLVPRHFNFFTATSCALTCTELYMNRQTHLWRNIILRNVRPNIGMDDRQVEFRSVYSHENKKERMGQCIATTRLWLAARISHLTPLFLNRYIHWMFSIIPETRSAFVITTKYGGYSVQSIMWS